MSTDINITAPSTTDPSVVITDATTIGAPEKPSTPFYKNWRFWVLSGMIFIVIVGGVVSLGLNFLTPHGAAGIVSHDGYTVMQGAAANEMKKGMGPEAKAYFGDDAAVGAKGTNVEAAVELNSSGKSMIPLVLPMISAAGHGISAHVDGDYLVISGPASSFENSSFAK